MEQFINKFLEIFVYLTLGIILESVRKEKYFINLAEGLWIISRPLPPPEPEPELELNLEE